MIMPNIRIATDPADGVQLEATLSSIEGQRVTITRRVGDETETFVEEAAPGPRFALLLVAVTAKPGGIPREALIEVEQTDNESDGIVLWTEEGGSVTISGATLSSRSGELVKVVARSKDGGLFTPSGNAYLLLDDGGSMQSFQPQHVGNDGWLLRDKDRDVFYTQLSPGVAFTAVAYGSGLPFMDGTEPFSADKRERLVAGGGTTTSFESDRVAVTVHNASPFLLDEAKL